MSRYENTKIYRNLLNRDKNTNKLKVSKYATTIYQTVPESNSDIFIITQDGDRLDNLAFQFYGDPHLWWFIANTNGLSHMNLEPGLSLRISTSIDNAVGL